ncbi:hypothetical protein TSUD_217370 [Trifolium subterraneum]|uniref:B-like cyclin n=1 Tax=Trifolium subterraneum TaxID=3900 RepID=A0A2Z6NWK7_TRISU|nr:hypothetical protein TSUD_217370 [Trifolium subterraneum]
MAPPSFDFPSLFCHEDSSIFDENDSFEMLDESSWQDECDPYLNQIPQFDDDSTQKFNEPIVLIPPPMLSDESLKDLVAKECHHLPASDYVNRLKYGDLDLQERMEAVDWIEKVGVHFGFGPLCLYLAISFMDRFLSVVEMLTERTWSFQLLAVGCLYLAAKIDETVVPRTVDMQMKEKKYLFDNKTMLKMELMVLSTLKWRMLGITPFSYIDYFLNKVNGEQVPIGDSVLQSFQLILSTVRGIDFIQFRPSEIAAAVAVTLSVKGENQTVRTEKAVSLLIEYVEKEKVMKCIEMIQQLSSNSLDSAKDTNASSEYFSHVLEDLCLNYKSDDDNNKNATSPQANSAHNSPEAKRKKPNI